MKKFLGGLFIALVVCTMGYVNLIGAPSQSGTDGTIVTSSGTTVITFDSYTSEIYWIRTSTNVIYIDYYSTECSSNSYSVKVRDGVVAWDTVEVNTSRMSIWTDNLDMELLVNGRSNR